MLSSVMSECDYVIVSADSQHSLFKDCMNTLEGIETWKCALTSEIVKSATWDAFCVSVESCVASRAMHQELLVPDIASGIDAEDICGSHITAKRTMDMLFHSEKLQKGSKSCLSW